MMNSPARTLADVIVESAFVHNVTLPKRLTKLQRRAHFATTPNDELNRLGTLIVDLFEMSRFKSWSLANW